MITESFCSPAIFSERDGGARGTDSIRHPNIPYVHKKNGFHSISSEKISVLNSYFIHKCII